MEAGKEIARVFWSGRSQAVRLPKGYRFQTDIVRIRKRGNSIILEPITENWNWLDDVSQKLDEDFISACNEEPSSQDRPDLDSLFS